VEPAIPEWYYAHIYARRMGVTALKSKMSVDTHEAFKISHRYATSGYYPIIVTGTDARSKVVSLQLVAFIKRPGDSATQGSILSPPADSGGNAKSTGGGMFPWLKYAWPTYGVVSVMALSFWLGERREFLQLMKIPGTQAFVSSMNCGTYRRALSCRHVTASLCR